MSEKKKRKPNWGKEDALTLTNLVMAHKTVLEGRFGPRITFQKRQETWQLITDSLNAVSNCQRTRDEVEKKWKNLKSQSKKAMADFKVKSVATGGGPPPPPLSPVTSSVVDVVGRENVTFHGIEDSFDSTGLQLQQMSTENVVTPQTTSVHSEPPTEDTCTAAAVETCTGANNPTTILQIVPAAPTSDKMACLQQEKLELEIQHLKLKIKMMELKLKKMEE